MSRAVEPEMITELSSGPYTVSQFRTARKLLSENEKDGSAAGEEPGCTEESSTHTNGPRKQSVISTITACDAVRAPQRVISPPP